jgi:hypothetical protein
MSERDPTDVRAFAVYCQIEAEKRRRANDLTAMKRFDEAERIALAYMDEQALAGADREPEAAAGGPNPLDVLALARVAARQEGYALTVHGSLSRDLDLVAVPWTDKASGTEVVVEAIRKAVGGWLVVTDPAGRNGYYAMDDDDKRSPIERPHGRTGWRIFGVLRHCYIDLSVVPLEADRVDWTNTGCPFCPRCGYPDAMDAPENQSLMAVVARSVGAPPEPEAAAPSDELERAILETEDWAVEHFVDQSDLVTRRKNNAWIVTQALRAALRSPEAPHGTP